MPKPSRGGKRSAKEVKAEIDANYGSYYTTLYQEGNIKLIKSNDGSANVPLETRTAGRIYGLVNESGNLKSISFYDKDLVYKSIDVTGRPHYVDGKKTLPHVHYGYPHGQNGTFNVTKEDQNVIDRVKKIWYNYKGK